MMYLNKRVTKTDRESMLEAINRLSGIEYNISKNINGYRLHTPDHRDVTMRLTARELHIFMCGMYTSLQVHNVRSK